MIENLMYQCTYTLIVPTYLGYAVREGSEIFWVLSGLGAGRCGIRRGPSLLHDYWSESIFT